MLCSSEVGYLVRLARNSTLPSHIVEDWQAARAVVERKRAVLIMSAQRRNAQEEQGFQPDRDATCVPTSTPCVGVRRSEALC
ncbi:hypothetical protein IG631_15614 [Alternaria alternata]|nr:hypothetical protein IG631_15614 [Alternaria alternata]